MVREFSTRVAGIYYSKGNVSGLNRGDLLRLVREPANPHDTNAIRVEMPGGVLVGRIPRDIAPSLAREMDSGLKAYAIIQWTSSGHAPVAPRYSRGGRSRRRSVKATPPECYITVKVGDGELSMPEFPPPQPAPPPPAPIPRPALPPCAPVQPASQPVQPKSSCFVATAVFLDRENSTVATLRHWRDNSLIRHWLGRLFVRGYARIGPALARLVFAFPSSRRLLMPLLESAARLAASNCQRRQPDP